MPQHPVHSPVKIPLFCTDEYTGTSFLQYFDEAGTTSANVVSLCKTTDSQGELHALLQIWAYFGLMSEIFGRTILIDDFTEKCTGGESYVTTKSLPEYVSKWIQSSRALENHEKRLKWDHMEKCVSAIRRILMEIYFESNDAIDTRLLLSVAVLVENLEAAKPLAVRELDLDTIDSNIKTRLKPSTGIIQGMEFVIQRMLNDGWCPRDVWAISKNASCTHLYFVSNLERPGPDKNHALLGCTSRKCHAYQVRHDEFKRKHTTHECCCPDIHASQQDLLKILSEEGESIPLIVPFAMQQQQNEFRSVQLISSEVECEYIAISHVWSDGLGNETQNAIPTCQFGRLSKLVTELCGGSPRPFWLDTLCFPLAPPDAYKLAMIRMRSTYEDAYKVLVLDSYLLSQERIGMSENGVVTRIRCSPCESRASLPSSTCNLNNSEFDRYIGSRRLWTLQEGALPSSLTFKFSDTSVDLSQFSKRRYERLEEAGFEFFKSSWDSFYELRAIEWDFDGGTLGPKSRSTRTTSLYNMHSAKAALASRSTSVQDDETLCLSALLNLDIEEILSSPDNEKIRWFFCHRPSSGLTQN